MTDVGEMHSLYRSGKTLREVGEAFGFTPSGVLAVFRRNRLPTRTPKEASKLTAQKFHGDTHWHRLRPRAIKPHAYRSRRVLDDDGLWHKRRVHVLMMEEKIGRRLFEYECVHHINGDRHDNRLENLRLMTKSEHARLEALAARATNPGRHRRKRDKKKGIFLPEPHKPWSTYNPSSPRGRAKKNKGLL